MKEGKCKLLRFEDLYSFLCNWSQKCPGVLHTVLFLWSYKIFIYLYIQV